MTNQEAINLIVRNRNVFKYDEQMTQALDFAIKALKRDVIADYNTGYQDGLEDGLNDIRDGWIPISERLPKTGEYVGSIAKYYLVQNEYGDMLVARYTKKGYWELMYHLGPYEDEIVAWMPLPEPYKKFEEEN